MKNKSALEKHVKASLVVTNALFKKHPEYKWTQKFVSDCMAALADDGALSFTDNGTFRTYTFKITTKVRSTKTPKAKDTSNTPSPAKRSSKSKTISKSKALDLMSGNKGRFFTAEFKDKKGEIRVMNCQYLKNQGTSKLGYVKVREAVLMRTQSDPKKTIRQINLQTVISLKIGGTLYKIK